MIGQSEQFNAERSFATEFLFGIFKQILKKFTLCVDFDTIASRAWLNANGNITIERRLNTLNIELSIALITNAIYRTIH